ncbi:MAG: GDSL family lipase [Actinobacteria bacterium 13_1_20CM_3_71_11]|nr:MAG: GDSL family lipase [Actinobacteria bacterium 13_1_20CM_3_71_11]
MNRRIAALLAALVALVALACKGGSDAGANQGGDTPTGKPRTDLPSSMVALGDSITAGFGSCLALTSCPRNSWATGDGTLVNSHYKRIRAGNPAIKGKAHNLSTAGAMVTDLPGQAAAAVGFQPEYVAILIGANDACRPGIDQMTSKAEFAAQFSAALTTLRKGLPKARVLVVSIPDVYHVWELAHTRRSAQEVWALGVCQALLANPASTAAADNARRQKFRERVDQYDAAMAGACKDYGPRCRWDGGAAHGVAFTIDKLNTLDFFHPNSEGQTALASVTYPGSFTWG